MKRFYNHLFHVIVEASCFDAAIHGERGRCGLDQYIVGQHRGQRVGSWTWNTSRELLVKALNLGVYLLQIENATW